VADGVRHLLERPDRQGTPRRHKCTLDRLDPGPQGQIRPPCPFVP
jgi:hypothetical protein